MSMPTINGIIDPKTPDGLLTLFEGASCTHAAESHARERHHRGAQPYAAFRALISPSLARIVATVSRCTS